MFKDPFWLALALPVLAAAAGLSAWAGMLRARVASALGRPETLSRIVEGAAGDRLLAARLRLAALALLLAALAGPQWGVELMETRGSARQVVVAVDVSLSMLAQDAKPSRLERAKKSLSLLLESMRGERVGVVAFAGAAHVVCPLTHDVEAAKQILEALDGGAVPTPGTEIGSAIRAASAMAGRFTGAKTVVLLTDGEDHRSDPLGAAREAAAAGVRVFAVGIGTAEGEPIPLEGGGYKKDQKGGTVISRLGEETLARVAQATGGGYYRSSPGMDEISEIVAKIKAGDPSRGLAATAARWRDRYAWPLSLACLLICLEMTLPLLTFKVRFKRARPLLAAALLLAAASARAAFPEGTLREGNRKYRAGEYDRALELYGEASGRKPSDLRPVFNAGNALFRLERDSDAAGAFDAVARNRTAPRDLRADALYNLGNSRLRAGDYGGAAEAYRSSLGLAPSDPDTRRNLVIALHHLKNPPPKQDKKDDKKNPPPKPENKDKGGEGGADKPNQPPRARPQDSMSREDAERVLRAVADREKAARPRSPDAANGRRTPARPPSEEDW
ncbi:MAG TPA: hypothetical protein DCZ01_06860 [Elusimicrobia bacterium]|nr:MAG: hypothetical protein A2X37_01675 [Elusimicrobia bacterium GWA2_66_18]OGR69441.1 MAG: hypothetical protein A2X40_00525 [Elusimicrobia bacterium GWC2_65_9]HAZ08230.1 hypothetical protein [Elusimicrobiota bacterium]